MSARSGMRVLVLRDAEVVADPPEPLAALARRDGQVLWIELTPPSADALGPVAEAFGLHPLAVEDALKRQQRPKAEDYEGFLFITVHAARQRGSHEVALDEIDLFYGRDYLVTVHSGAAAAVEEARRRVVQAPPELRSARGYLLYALLDAVVDTYFPVLDAMDAYIERLEDTLFKRPHPRTLDRLFAAKRSLLALRRVAGPQRDMMNLLLRHESALVDERLRAYFRDIYDHLLRITDGIDTHRDLLAGAVEIYLSLTSNRLNEVVKVLTIITAVFASLAVITGVYGMNFERAYPPFDWRYGFPAALGLMAASVAVMLAIFRRLGWL
ncbi:MAG: magnesium/cobalt transporter CorA [Armatimonadota bacterium]|nr:magnesium/cobalt transporter CorA [Armatimonadota bacterium]